MITLNQLNEIAALRGDENCIIDNNGSYTWFDIIRKTKSRVVFLRRSFDAEQLRSVCYLSKNNAELICWLAAFATLGIPANGLDYSLPANTLNTLLNRINPGVLLISFDLYTSDELNMLNTGGASMLAVDAPTDTVISSIGDLRCSEFESLMSTHIRPTFRAVSLTSGTSAVPKIVLRYQSFDARRFSWFKHHFSFSSNDGFLLILPLYHAAGNGWARMFMGLGAPLYLVDQDDISALEYIISLRTVRASVMTPNLVSRLTEIINRKGLSHHLRWVLVGGSYFSIKNKLAAQTTLGNIFCEYYGCTESGVNVLSEPADMLSYPESVGRPFDGNHVMILDADNRPLGTGEKGRVAISSYMLMDEYGDGSKPFIMFGDERYFLMADYGYIDSNNRLFLINRNGESYSDHDIYRIEENIRSLPCINDVAVVLSGHKGEVHVKCIFSTNNKGKDKIVPLIEKITEQASIAGVVNIAVRQVEEIPYSPSGKVRVSEVVRYLNAA